MFLDLLFYLVSAVVIWYAYTEHRIRQADRKRMDEYALRWETLDEDEPRGKGRMGR